MTQYTTLSDVDVYLFGEGTLRRAYDHLGAHPADNDESRGTRFGVWAPNAESVSVIGDFNNWDPGVSPLAPVQNSGIWQGFVPDAYPGSLYKYSIVPGGRRTAIDKADPYAFAAELRPATASIIADLSRHEWGDATWIRRRSERAESRQPVSVYELHAGSWRRSPNRPEAFLTYRDLAEQLPEYARSMGYTHVQFLPIAEHPLDASWGYQTTGYFAPTARFGAPEDFMYLVDRCHQAEIGVLLDWVPAHFPRDAHGLAQFDGSHLYEHADPRQGEHPDWGTLIFNYGRNEVRSFLLSNALFWLDRYHVDGLRVDAVASMLYLDYSREPGQWVPNRYGGRENLEAVEVLQLVNTAAHEDYPGVLMVAEESTAWPGVTKAPDVGGLGFDLKWNMGWMHDTLAYLSHDPIYRSSHQADITFSLVYAFSERYILPLSHDEVVHGKASLVQKMPGDEWQKFANVRLLLAYMWTHPGKKLLFMGDDFGQWTEWNFERSLDWHLLDLPGDEGDLHRGLQRLVRDLNGLLASQSQFYRLDDDPAGFEWIDYQDAENSVIAYVRNSDTDAEPAVVVINFTPLIRRDYRVGVPVAGSYTPLLNSDAHAYGGSGVELPGPVHAEAVAWHGRAHSVCLTLPPLAVLVLGST